MVDKTNPTNQFHPYQPAEATPVAERPAGGMKDMLNNLNLSNLNIEKVRSMAANKPGLVLGGLAAAAIGLGMLRGRRS
jgi:hypothetical protein